MSKLTERLLQIGAVVVILYLCWQLSAQTFVSIIQANNRATIAEQRVQACEQRKVTP